MPVICLTGYKTTAMKRSIYFGLVILLITGLSACRSYDYYTAGLNRTNMSSYRTFAWMPADNGTNKGEGAASAVADGKIKDATTQALQAKGLKLSQGNPDLVVSYSSMVGRGTRTNYYPVYYGAGFYPGWRGWGGWGGWGFGWGWGWGYRPYYYAYGAPFAYYGGAVAGDKEHFKEGTLIIDLIDTRTKRVVWRGYGVGEVHKNPQKTIDDLPKVVGGIIDQLQLAPPSRRS